MLAALTKCEDSLNVDPPSSEILYSSNINSSTIDSEEGVASKKPRGLNQNHNHRTKEPLYVSSSGTAVSCMPSFSGLPRFSFNIDQELSDDRLTIVKKNLQLQTLQRRLTYLAEFYYRDLRQDQKKSLSMNIWFVLSLNTCCWGFVRSEK